MTDRHGKTGKGYEGDQAVITSRFDIEVESVEDAERIDALVRELIERETGKGGGEREDGEEPATGKAGGRLPREVRLMRTRFLRCMGEASFELEEGRPTNALVAVDEALEIANDAVVALAQAPVALDDRLASHVLAAASGAHAARYAAKEGETGHALAMCERAARLATCGFDLAGL